MKKLFIAFAFLLSTQLSYAQYDPDARAVLDAMSEKYKSFEAFAAGFKQEFTNENAGIDESMSGEIIVKDNQYVLDIAGQKIYNDGNEMWRYDEEMAEVTVTINEPEEQEISMNNIFDLYKDGFKYILMGQNQRGERMIELDPITKDKSYYKIKMVIDKNDMLKNFSVLERSGNTYKYIIEDFKTMKDVSAETFAFNVGDFPNVEVVDFR
ncbi:MAG: outer membrane lipoprotein carrier protein [Cyclobacteriaceae bacterium]|jgi:outer membrane lipoprotein-sorting protein